MSSGTAGDPAMRFWNFVPDEKRTVDPLMGWTSSQDTQAQVRIRFGHEEGGAGLRPRPRDRGGRARAEAPQNEHPPAGLRRELRDRPARVLDPLALRRPALPSLVYEAASRTPQAIRSPDAPDGWLLVVVRPGMDDEGRAVAVEDVLFEVESARRNIPRSTLRCRAHWMFGRSPGCGPSSVIHAVGGIAGHHARRRS